MCFNKLVSIVNDFLFQKKKKKKQNQKQKNKQKKNNVIWNIYIVNKFVELGYRLVVFVLRGKCLWMIVKFVVLVPYCNLLISEICCFSAVL